jgi:hypothetical protein
LRGAGAGLHDFSKIGDRFGVTGTIELSEIALAVGASQQVFADQFGRDDNQRALRESGSGLLEHPAPHFRRVEKNRAVEAQP